MAASKLPLQAVGDHRQKGGREVRSQGAVGCGPLLLPLQAVGDHRQKGGRGVRSQGAVGCGPLLLPLQAVGDHRQREGVGGGGVGGGGGQESRGGGAAPLGTLTRPLPAPPPREVAVQGVGQPGEELHGVRLSVDGEPLAARGHNGLRKGQVGVGGVGSGGGWGCQQGWGVGGSEGGWGWGGGCGGEGASRRVRSLGVCPWASGQGGASSSAEASLPGRQGPHTPPPAPPPPPA